MQQKHSMATWFLAISLLLACQRAPESGNPVATRPAATPAVPAETATSGGSGRADCERVEKTLSGVEFCMVSDAALTAAGITDIKTFGPGWKDPSGLIWGLWHEPFPGLSARDQPAAAAHCDSIGAKLPSGYDEDFNGRSGFPAADSDFVRLRKYLGAKPKTVPPSLPNTYVPQILDLTRGPGAFGPYFWSDSAYPSSDHNFVFNGETGDISSQEREATPPFGRKEMTEVRCVVQAVPAPPVAGGVYTWMRDRNHPELGEAWRAPNGTVWGDIVTQADGSQDLSHQDALSYCQGIGAELPNRGDFELIRGYMGGKGFRPQVLPNLTYVNGGGTHGYRFWTATLSNNNSLADVFDGEVGEFGASSLPGREKVRCIVR